jgi:hypothetical protein
MEVMPEMFFAGVIFFDREKSHALNSRKYSIPSGERLVRRPGRLLEEPSSRWKKVGWFKTRRRWS